MNTPMNNTRAFASICQSCKEIQVAYTTDGRVKSIRRNCNVCDTPILLFRHKHLDHQFKRPKV